MKPNCKTSKIKKITDECSFINCTKDGGEIYFSEEKKIVFFNLLLTINVTSSWNSIINLPKKYACQPLIESAQSSSITGTVFWIQPDTTNSYNTVLGELTAGKQIVLQGYYFLKDFLD